ncbi:MULTISPECIES: antitoxin Xre/MbcA/ParS toxin-binding domain-containing protein [Luteimonas]|uniref:antitoxin Xre/MbcA/ParS toxin-binding domain-containing protein n=1 Tax=Luteimonas TaxID=83614 RepID=UPI000C7BCB80|nr:MULTISPECIES: antitoxin Xre/MbcA/ParS toxin-binding domain-containing protein [Luteimonas]
MSGHDVERCVLSAAAMVTDASEARRWYHDDPIAALDGSTAADLVRDGHGARVLEFLMTVLRHETAAVSRVTGAASPHPAARPQAFALPR